MKLEDCLFPELRCGDKIKIRAKDNTLVDSIVLRWQNTDYSHTLEAPSVIKATVKYENPESVLDVAKRTEVIVNKQNQKIDGIVEQVGEHESVLVQHTQSIEGLEQKVSKVGAYKSEASGLTQIHLTEAGALNVVELEIRGNKTYINDLYPEEDLYPNQEGGV